MKLKNKELIIIMANKQMNYKQLSERANVSKATIAYMKKGRPCKVEVAGKIAHALDVDVTEIFDVTE